MAHQVTPAGPDRFGLGGDRLDFGSQSGKSKLGERSSATEQQQ